MSKSEKKVINRIFVILGSITLVLLLAVSCATWFGYKFITDSVRTELSSQKIYFPKKGDAAIDPQQFPTIQRYAGQIVDDGIKAKAYANDFIAKHLEVISGGKTYSEISAESLADPTNTTLSELTQLVFRGTMLRGMLLSSGYAYWMMGITMQYVAFGSFIAAGIVAILVCLGIRRSWKLR